MTRPKGVRPLDANAGARRNLALQLRIQGLTQTEIAARVGVSQSHVSRMIRQALASERAERVEELRAIELKRMEHVHRVMGEKVDGGDTAAAGVLVRAAERRSRLMGLDLGNAEGSGRHVTLSVLVGFESAIGETTYDAQQVGDAAIAAASAALPPAVTAQRIVCRVYGGVNIAEV